MSVNNSVREDRHLFFMMSQHFKAMMINLRLGVQKILMFSSLNQRDQAKWCLILLMNVLVTLLLLMQEYDRVKVPNPSIRLQASF